MNEVSPLGRRYRYNLQHNYLEAAIADAYHPTYRVSNLPSLLMAASTPGELEAIIGAREAAFSEAEMVGVVTVGETA